MKDVLKFRKRRNAQTLVFFLLAWGTIMLLCGLAIDSGLLYLAKARMGRAVDGAALAAVGNFNRNGASPALNRDAVALIMRNFAVANFTSLAPISSVGGASGGTPTTYTQPNGTQGVSYYYSFNDGTMDPNGAHRRFVDITLNTGSGGAITGATCNARCPVQTYFIGYATYAINGRQNVKIAGYSGPSALADLKVSSSAVATRNPRLIMVVLDRSASMLETPGGGAVGLAPAVVQFLDFFDTSSDTIGIVSFGTNARLEMPMTTNFIIAGTNNLIDGYETNSTYPGNAPGIDPELVSSRPQYQQYYASGGVRRLKFGGQTAADDGIRLGLEQMEANPGFNDPDVVKYLVIFTDGAWNATRSLFAAPPYTNQILAPYFNAAQSATNIYLTNAVADALTNGAPGAWVASTTLIEDIGILPVPSLGLDPTKSSLPYITTAITTADKSAPGTFYDYSDLAPSHLNDVWQSSDGINEPLTTHSVKVGASMLVTNTTYLGTNAVPVGAIPAGGIKYYTHNVDVWLTPGSVAYYYLTNSGPTPTVTSTYVSDYTNPTKHINIKIQAGGRVDLVVPGYITDGIFYDGLDLTLPDNFTAFGEVTYPRFRQNNYQEAFMWPDDSSDNSPFSTANPYLSTSLMRQLMFRNYPNLLTGYYIARADDPLAPFDSSKPTGQQGVEPLITDQTNSAGVVGAPRPLHGLGAYYPDAAVYWPFGGDADVNGFITNAVGIDYESDYALANPISDPDVNYSQADDGGSRHGSYSINMLSTNASPEWYGELFYNSTTVGAGTNSFSGISSSTVSKVMHSDDWKTGMPGFMVPLSLTGIMMDEANHNSDIVGTPSVWRPSSFNGSNFPVSFASIAPGASATGGYVSDGNGHYFKDTMAYSGRPTHYYDFSKSSWEPIADNHTKNVQALQLGNWKAGEYCWHARALGVTVYTVGYGTHVAPGQCALLAQLANSTNVIAPQSTGSSVITTNNSAFNPGQPIGQQFYATTAAQISNDFFSIGQAINAALTQ